MSTAIRARTRMLNRARFATDAHPIPAPSCLGGAHRRCLLQADTCCCPCHRGVDLGPKPPPVTPAFPCAICGTANASEAARVDHFRDEHPVVTTSEHGQYPVDRPRHRIDTCTLDRCEICYGDKPTSSRVHHPRGIYRCRVCDNQPFLSERALLDHQAIAHGAVAS